jgi:NADPH:quinone reductase-like Zn-dependent oxidoreductase
MKALLPSGGLAMVEFGDVDQPRPLASEALVRVEAFSVNRGETFLLEKPPAGWRPGKDIAGFVVQGAADGSGPPAGRRVVGHPPAAGWAEYACVPAESVAELPEDIPAATAAALPLAGLTALRLLRMAGSVTGQRILLTGASGGVGHYLVELAGNAGAEVTAVTASAQRGSRLAELGATAVLRSVTDADGPYNLVLESVGGDSLARSLATLNFFDLLYGATSATIRHFSYTSFPEPYGADLAVLVRLVAAGRLHPEIGRVADWHETAAVLADLRERRIRGNAVLTTSPSASQQTDRRP